MYKSFENLFFIFLVSTVLGCAQSDNGEQTFNMPDHFIPVNRPNSVTDYEGVWDKEQRREFLGQIEYFKKAVFSGESWQIADKYARLCLESEYLPSHEKYAYEQIIAHEILKYKLIKEEQTPEVVEAISFYTELLLKNEHQDASVMKTSIERLHGVWSEEKIKHASEISYKASKQYFEEQKNCTDCASKVFEKMIISNKNSLLNSKNNLEFQTLESMMILKAKADL